MKDRYRSYTWFVEPLDAFTNQVIASRISEENAHEGIECADGVARNLWECLHRFISELRRNESELGIRFKIFCREGHGGIRQWTLGKSSSVSAVLAITTAIALRQSMRRTRRP